MKIEHLAIWVADLELVRDFYQKHFKASASAKYHNPDKEFSSYFMTFPDGGARLEIMESPKVSANAGHRGLQQGQAHFAIAVGSEQEVRMLTDRLRVQGHKVVSEPRTTGDGYYESVVLDPEGNPIEITV